MATVERAFGVTNIKTHIPIILDLDVFNYDAWRELFLTHCLAFDVLGHVDGTAIPTEDDDIAWKKRDGLVKLWIYGTLTHPLFKSTFKVGGTARDIWLRIENQFRNNKEARAIQLDNDLRTKEIGDMTIHDYSQSLQAIADLLANVDAQLNDKTLVMYLLNGLNDKFDHIINVIKHHKPFPTFEEATNMLELEETRLKKPHKTHISHTDHASSSTALVATSSDSKQSNNNNRNTNRNNRGNRRGSRGKGRHNYNQRSSYNNWGMNPYWQGYNNWNMQQQAPWMNFPQPNGFNPRGCAPRGGFTNNTEGHMVDNSCQPTRDFAEAFNTMTLTEPSPTWYMDFGASPHIASNPGILQSVFNMDTGKSVIVGNGSSVPIH